MHLNLHRGLAINCYQNLNLFPTLTEKQYKQIYKQSEEKMM